VDPNDELSSETEAPDPSPGSESAPDASDDKSRAESSPAKDEERKTLLDVVKDALDVKSFEEDDDVVEKKSAPKADPSPAEGDKSKPGSDSKVDSKDDVSDTALLAALEKLKADDVPLNKIERFREVLAENRQLKGQNEQYKQLDTTFAEIGADARKMGLSEQDLAQLFAWPRMLANDPKAAVEQLHAFAAQWQEKIGHTLPVDLKQKVDDGTLDEDSAKEIAQLRASAALAKTRTTAESIEREQASTAQRRNEIVTSVNAYQDELRRTDPDYTLEKHEMVVDSLTAMVTARGVPSTVADARAMAKEAYDNVTRRLAKFKPQPRAVASPQVGRRLNKPAESQPKSMREAIEGALGM
jgi:hypothetical protein